MQYVVPNISTPESLRVAEEVGIIVNELRLPIIKIYRKNRRFTGGNGFMGVSYKKLAEPRELPDGETQYYTHEIAAKALRFGRDPYGHRDCAYLLDDSEPVPGESLSGAKKGWNREALASLMTGEEGAGLFEIEDPEIAKDVQSRAKKILEGLENTAVEREEIQRRMRKMSEMEDNKRKGVGTVNVSVGQSDNRELAELREMVMKQNKIIMELTAKKPGKKKTQKPKEEPKGEAKEEPKEEPKGEGFEPATESGFAQ